MFEGLSDELEARGIVAGPYGDLLDFEWCQDVESEKWVLSTAVRIVESYDEDKNVALSIDPHSILCLARAVEYVPISIEVPILVDLCVVAKAVCVVKGVPAPIMFHVEMLLA